MSEQLLATADMFPEVAIRRAMPALPQSKRTQLRAAADGDEQRRMQRKRVISASVAASVPPGVVTQQHTACYLS